MAPRGGYRKSNRDEWMKTTQLRYAEAITSATVMGQDPETWLSDAIAHHVYRCELLIAQQAYAEACREAAAALRPNPLQSEYLPDRPAPTITRTEGKGSSPGQRQHRP